MRKPKIYLWDLETGYNIVNVFSLAVNSKYIPYSALQQERYIICGTVEELGYDNIWTYSVDPKRPIEDQKVVKGLLSKLSEADAIIAHNGDNFDLKFFNTRAVYHGFDLLPNIISIDTLKIARKHFNFNSNRLDYLAKFLGVGKKVD